MELNKKQESEDTAKAGFWEEFEVGTGDSEAGIDEVTLPSFCASDMALTSPPVDVPGPGA